MSDKWLNYVALAQLWGISPEAARTRARRGRYQRRVGNDGQAEVLVDMSAPFPKARPPRSGEQTRTPVPSDPPDADTAPRAALEALEGHIATLRDQLGKAEALAAQRDREAAAEREKVADLTSRLLQITADLLEAQKTEARPRSWWQRLTG